MYSRNYYADEAELKIPENYDGTALIEGVQNEDVPPMTQRTEIKISPADRSDGDADAEEVFMREDRERNSDKSNEFDLFSIFSGQGLKNLSLKSLIPKIGTEELLLLALAAFLLLSKSGDKECAIMVLILVFIK